MDFDTRYGIKQMEHHFYDIGIINPNLGRVIGFTGEFEIRWTGIAELPPGKKFFPKIGYRTDIYILYGEVVSDNGKSYAIGDYISDFHGEALIGSLAGASLYIFCEPAPNSRASMIYRAEERSWGTLRIGGMHAADLTNGDHRVALIRWGPQTYVPPHVNPRGEELFVLSGELCVNNRALAAGSWLRLGPGELHDSGASQSALIILRSGHLPALSTN